MDELVTVERLLEDIIKKNKKIVDMEIENRHLLSARNDADFIIITLQVKPLQIPEDILGLIKLWKTNYIGVAVENPIAEK